MHDLAQRAAELVPAIRKRAVEAETLRRLPLETIRDLRDIGLFRAFVPSAYGGDQRSMSEVLAGVTELGTGCASTAWVAALTAVHNLAASWLPKPGLEELFSDGPDVVTTSSVAPTGTMTRTDGGYRLAGRWGFSSGIDHANWIMLGAVLHTGENELLEYRLNFVRSTEVSVIDDWQSMGLRGTGSKSLQVGDVHVPECRSLRLRPDERASARTADDQDGSRQRVPWEAAFNSAFPSAALGASLAMLEAFRQHSLARVSKFSGRGFKTNSGAAMRMAGAAAQVDAARLMYVRDLAELDRMAKQPQSLAPGCADRIAYDASFIVDQCSRAVQRLFRGSGGKAAYQGSDLQRHFRDIQTMTLHAALDMDGTSEAYGRKLFQTGELRSGSGALRPSPE
jgi:3-hydroxy-9,10-secoandrosta-1,3,5(10)-triene-9,17-dione monooxygenase